MYKSLSQNELSHLKIKSIILADLPVKLESNVIIRMQNKQIIANIQTAFCWKYVIVYGTKLFSHRYWNAAVVLACKSSI